MFCYMIFSVSVGSNLEQSRGVDYVHQLRPNLRPPPLLQPKEPNHPWHSLLRRPLNNLHHQGKV